MPKNKSNTTKIRTIKPRKKRQSRNEFRYNYNTKHINYIFEEEVHSNKLKRLHGIGLTTKSKTFGKQNTPLEINPKKGDKRKSYLRNGIISEKETNFSQKRDNRFNFDKTDMPKVRAKRKLYQKHRKNIKK